MRQVLSPFSPVRARQGWAILSGPEDSCVVNLNSTTPGPCVGRTSIMGFRTQGGMAKAQALVDHKPIGR